MNIRHQRVMLAGAVMALFAACATVPPGPPPDVVRLQNNLDRLHSDPRIANNAGTELANADAAVDVLSRNARTLPPREYQQGVYIADKLIGIAEASALARFAEQRGSELGMERERLLARNVAVVPGTTTTRTVVTETGAPTTIVTETPADRPVAVIRTRDGQVIPQSRAELMAMQNQLPGIESRSGNYKLVFTFAENVASGGQAVLTDGKGTLSGSPTVSGKTVAVNLTGVADVQTVTIDLNNVTSVTGKTFSGGISMGVLIGDINGDGVVDDKDVATAKNATSYPGKASDTDFRSDIDANGAINSTDVTLAKSKAALSHKLKP